MPSAPSVVVRTSRRQIPWREARRGWTEDNHPAGQHDVTRDQSVREREDLLLHRLAEVLDRAIPAVVITSLLLTGTALALARSRAARTAVSPKFDCFRAPLRHLGNAGSGVVSSTWHAGRRAPASRRRATGTAFRRSARRRVATLRQHAEAGVGRFVEVNGQGFNRHFSAARSAQSAARRLPKMTFPAASNYPLGGGQRLPIHGWLALTLSQSLRPRSARRHFHHRRTVG